ncbi:MAG: hypothetical protein ACXVHT_03340 [Methanobacterium sp.]
MDIEKGKLNCFFIDTHLSWKSKKNSHAIFINATEEEFNGLLDDYISETESQGREFHINFFRNYMLKQGYYCYAELYKVWPPYAPFKEL